MTVSTPPGIEALTRSIDHRLEELLPRSGLPQASLDSALRDGILAPGKRLRPLMTALVADDLGGDLAAAIDVGCAVEMVHAASLILDDLPAMDDAELRRGRPTLHRRHGEDVAILASIAALSQAYGVIASATKLPGEARLECIRLLSNAVGVRGLVCGQFQDLRGGGRPLSDIAAVNGLKTGSLFIAAVGMGAAVADAPASTRTALTEFGQEIGQAFQLLDDLLDLHSSPQAIGKDIGQDVGKATIVSLIGRGPMQRRLERHVEAAFARLTEIFGPSSRMAQLAAQIFSPLPGSAAPAGPFSEGELLEREAGAR